MRDQSKVAICAGAVALLASPAFGQPAEFPPNAQPGECYARVFVPATYETDTETVVTRQASERVEVIPAKYEWVNEKILSREVSEKLVVVPATYDWVEEKVLVKPASHRLVEVAAKYEWTSEKILDKPAHTIWKKGAGPVQKIDHATGEIMCLVEVPATYKVLKKRILKEGATTRKVEIPAEYKVVKRRIVKTPPTTRKIEIPAEYKSVRVRRLVTEAQEKRIPIPQQSKQITKRKKVTEGRLAWEAVLCRTNMSPGMITNLQRSLLRAGHNPGPIDGVIGTQTLAAIRSFQSAKNLSRGGLTMETLRALGVK